MRAVPDTGADMPTEPDEVKSDEAESEAESETAKATPKGTMGVLLSYVRRQRTAEQDVIREVVHEQAETTKWTIRVLGAITIVSVVGALSIAAGAAALKLGIL